jgi:hypothetical protein
MLLIIVLWLVIAIVVGVGANGRGRSGFGWFLLAVRLSPLIAGLLLVVLPDLYVRNLLEGPRRMTEVDDRALKRNVERGRKGY